MAEFYSRKRLNVEDLLNILDIIIERDEVRESIVLTLS